jgi:hypothetical protein
MNIDEADLLLGGSAPDRLWTGDRGTLAETSRRALVRLLQGPYLSGAAHPQLWAALAADEAAIRSALHNLFLDLVIDPVDEFAFTRKVRTVEVDVPQTLRSTTLTFAATVMLLVLRQILLAAVGERRVIVGKTEVYERLAVYRQGDEATYQRNLNSAWNQMVNKFRVLHELDDGRAEISPVLKFLIDDEQVGALTEVFHRLASGAEGDPQSAPADEGSTVDDEDES